MTQAHDSYIQTSNKQNSYTDNNYRCTQTSDTDDNYIQTSNHSTWYITYRRLIIAHDMIHTDIQLTHAATCFSLNDCRDNVKVWRTYATTSAIRSGWIFLLRSLVVM